MADKEPIVYINEARNDMAEFMRNSINKVSSKGGTVINTAMPEIISQKTEQTSFAIPSTGSGNKKEMIVQPQAQDVPIPFFCYYKGNICTVDVICRSFPLPVNI